MPDFVAFSGGVDSTALALLMPDATPVFTDTGWEYQHVYDHITHFEQVTEREVVRIASPHGSIPEYIVRQKFLPSHGARYCTRLFKIEPMNEYLSAHLPATLNIALRADEPADMRAGNLTTMKGLTIAYPLREMGIKRLDVVKLCLKHDLLPRYPPYAARGGCKGCFYKRKSEIIAMQALVPEVVDELRELEEAVQDERGRYFYMFPNAGVSIADIQAQQPLFDMEQVYEDASNTDDYGQACGLFCNR